MDGVLVLDKPTGMTSFDVVRRIKHASGVRRVGHGGTLDPLASGVLPICLGEATKLAQFLLEADKEYEATIRFGVETDTYDADGAETRRADPSAITEAAVAEALAGFRGAIRQKAPVYSALKRDGQPLYAYARRGEAVDPPERAVTIHDLRLSRFAGPQGVSVFVRCSKGTYIRSLAFDLGRVLGPGAHLTALRRTRSGPFTIVAARALPEILAALQARDPAALPLVGLTDGLAHLPQAQADAGVALALQQGKAVPWSALAGALSPPSIGGQFQVVGPDGRLLAVARTDAAHMVRTLRVFNIGPPSPEAGKRASV
ncbi:MAG TPA: tRNA pseudouridine(55) synthase TruB [Polyangia bacterium]|jgi:tRNA pseudouridine55 synthase|nr:tRNA pseudouridine(55) synthase TruB [Polyangia bacterium]